MVYFFGIWITLFALNKHKELFGIFVKPNAEAVKINKYAMMLSEPGLTLTNPVL